MELKDCLRRQMLKLDLADNKIPEGERKQLLIDWVNKHFGYLKPQQIDEAFDLAIMGKTGVDANCYNVFSCEYVGRILAGYVAYKKASGDIASSFDKARQFKDSGEWKVTPLSEETKRIMAEIKQQLEERKKNKVQ